VVESEDEGEDEKGNVADLDGSDTEPEQEAEVDEDEFLRQEQARLKEMEATLRTAKLRRDVERRAATVAALLAEEDGSNAAPEAAAAVVVNQTPARSNLRPRVLAFQSTVGRKAPSPAALAQQASINALPDIAPTSKPVTVVVTPTIAVGSGRVSAPSVVTVVPVAPASVAAPRLTVPKPEKFSGDDPTQNERVESWVGEVDRWLRLSKVPPELHLDLARSYITSTGNAGEWILQKEEEAAHAGKEMTWAWLQLQLVQHYAQPSGVAAMQAEWQALRMGVWDKNAEGADKGRSTRTVKAYTNRFLHYMRRLTSDTSQTGSILVIDRYVAGIREGYEALYRVMLGVQPVLRFATLQEAVEAAELAEVDLAIRKTTTRTSTSSVLSSPWGAGGRPGGRGKDRLGTETLNNLQGEASDEGETETGSPPSRKSTKKAQVFAFVFNPATQPKDGRYELKQKEGQMLYNERRCFRCHQEHPTGRDKPPCTNPMAKTAPQSLKSKK
jgi:hypothetical protein